MEKKIVCYCGHVNKVQLLTKFITNHDTTHQLIINRGKNYKIKMCFKQKSVYFSNIPKI